MPARRSSRSRAGSSSGEPVRVATWNVNSIRSRLARVVAWLQREQPDVLCLQETKVVDADFPRDAFEPLGYRVETFGQKTFNGVALLAREAPRDPRRGLPGDGPDDQKRLIGARLGGIDILNVYVPNGQEVGSDKFAYKLDWLGRLRRLLDTAYDPSGEVLVCGDFNIAPEDRDVHDPDLWRGQVLFHPDEHAALGRLTAWGLTDALRLRHPEGGLYTWWDYRALAFPRNHGLRIDYLLVTAPLAARCEDVVIHRDERKGEKPSDHAPVVATFRDADPPAGRVRPTGAGSRGRS
jgi:exodeoxyribonuclease III